MTTHREEHIEHSERSFGACALARRRIAVLALVGIGMLGGVAIGASDTASAHPGYGGWRHFKGSVSLEEIRAHAKDKVAWLAGTSNATPEQRQQIEGVVDGLIEELYPLMQQHRNNRRVFVSELAQPELSRQAFDEWRETEMDLFESTSDKVLDGIFTIARILTPEQRRSLAERLQP